jgi:hypothetical protein
MIDGRHKVVIADKFVAREKKSERPLNSLAKAAVALVFQSVANKH